MACEAHIVHLVPAAAGFVVCAVGVAAHNGDCDFLCAVGHIEFERLVLADTFCTFNLLGFRTLAVYFKEHIVVLIASDGGDNSVVAGREAGDGLRDGSAATVVPRVEEIGAHATLHGVGFVRAFFCTGITNCLCVPSKSGAELETWIDEGIRYARHGIYRSRR